jgi:lipopolysaccharide biosynthesis glycosyltransferase
MSSMVFSDSDTIFNGQIEIVMVKSEKFDELMAAAAAEREEREAAEAEEQS